MGILRLVRARNDVFVAPAAGRKLAKSFQNIKFLEKTFLVFPHYIQSIECFCEARRFPEILSSALANQRFVSLDKRLDGKSVLARHASSARHTAPRRNGPTGV
jgi:hypothetical protein